MGWERCDECRETIRSSRAYNDLGRAVHPCCRLLAHAAAGTVREPQEKGVRAGTPEGTHR